MRNAGAIGPQGDCLRRDPVGGLAQRGGQMAHRAKTDSLGPYGGAGIGSDRWPVKRDRSSCSVRRDAPDNAESTKSSVAGSAHQLSLRLSVAGWVAARRALRVLEMAGDAINGRPGGALGIRRGPPGSGM